MNIQQMIHDLEEFFAGERGFSLSAYDIYEVLCKMRSFSEYSEMFTISRWCDVCLDYTDVIIITMEQNTTGYCAGCGHEKEKIDARSILD